jgi:hypothetical protein
MPNNAVQDLRSLPLYDIIGAPISAMVQAEAQAARTALEFIEKVGFERVDDDSGSPVDAGMLRMVEFGYVKPDANGVPAEFVARIPLLALLPIPGIRIKMARISFAAKISDVSSETTSTTPANETPGDPSWVDSPGVQFRGSLVSSTSDQLTQSSYDLNISIELEQTPIAPGMAKLINLLDQAISEVPRLPSP